VLVTGASGFIGRQTLPVLLSHGHELHALARHPPTVAAAGDAMAGDTPAGDTPAGDAAAGDVVWHEGDLLDGLTAAALIERIRPEMLLHLAWTVEPGRFWTSPENVRWVEASLALLRAFVAAGGRRAVLAGTCAEYDWTIDSIDSAALPRGDGEPGGSSPPRRDGEPGADSPPRLRERDAAIAPATLYGAAKHATHLVAEQLAWEADVQLGWGRVFYLYGPHEQPARLVPAIARSLLAGDPTPTSDGRQLRDFIHVADVAGAFVALLESDVEGPVNIATGDAVEVREVIETIAAHTGREDLLRWGAIPRAASDPDAIVADATRLREEVGFAAEIALADGLRETVEWWRARLAGERSSDGPA
jgi:dTDP-L-rhamnose 4-epimerase